MTQPVRSEGRRMFGVLSRRASGAIVTEFVNAGGSFVLQLLAVRSLGASGYGSFALVISTVVLLTSIQTAWVGDSLTVLDRFDPRVRGAIIGSQAGFALLSFFAAFGIGLGLGLTGVTGSVLFGLMTALWVTEEAARRIFMARLEFWQLVGNDSIYLAASLIALVGLRVATGHVSIDVFIGSMTAGALTAILADFIQLPRHELRLTRWRAGGGREVAAFAGWRAGQAAIRPAALLLMRLMIIWFTSRAVLGEIEAARLLLAPAITLVGGAGSFLLPLYAADERSGGKSRLLSVRLAVVGLAGSCAALAVFAFVLRAPLSRLLTNGGIHISAVGLIGWGLYATAFAAGLPAANAAIARRLSREVFVIRLCDTIAGLTLVMIALVSGHASFAPAAIAAGMLVAAVWLTRLVSATTASVPFGDPISGITAGR